jgi:hypothetical protein
VQTRKLVTDDVQTKLVLHVYPDNPLQLAELDALYKKPLEISIEISAQPAENA